MEKFESFTQGLINEAEVAIRSLEEMKGSDDAVNLLKRVQDAIANGNIDELNKIIEENGNKTD